MEATTSVVRTNPLFRPQQRHEQAQVTVLSAAHDDVMAIVSKSNDADRLSRSNRSSKRAAAHVKSTDVERATRALADPESAVSRAFKMVRATIDGPQGLAGMFPRANERDLGRIKDAINSNVRGGAPVSGVEASTDYLLAVTAASAMHRHVGCGVENIEAFLGSEHFEMACQIVRNGLNPSVEPVPPPRRLSLHDIHDMLPQLTQSHIVAPLATQELISFHKIAPEMTAIINEPHFALSHLMAPPGTKILPDGTDVRLDGDLPRPFVGTAGLEGVSGLVAPHYDLHDRNIASIPDSLPLADIPLGYLSSIIALEGLTNGLLFSKSNASSRGVCYRVDTVDAHGVHRHDDTLYHLQLREADPRDVAIIRDATLAALDMPNLGSERRRTLLLQAYFTATTCRDSSFLEALLERQAAYGIPLAQLHAEGLNTAALSNSPANVMRLIVERGRGNMPNASISTAFIMSLYRSNVEGSLGGRVDPDVVRILVNTGEVSDPLMRSTLQAMEDGRSSAPGMAARLGSPVAEILIDAIGWQPTDFVMLNRDWAMSLLRRLQRDES